MIANWIQAIIKPSVRKLKAADLSDFRRKHPDSILVDVRGESEAREEGLIPGAVRAEWKTQAFAEMARRFPKQRPLIVFCQGGARSEAAADALTHHGFAKVYTLEGGITAWQSTRKR
jgi:rhodanese-related sulfurtransferase